MEMHAANLTIFERKLTFLDVNFLLIKWERIERDRRERKKLKI